jgi:hypothetical protein
MVGQDQEIDFSAGFAAAIADREAQQIQEQLNEPEPPVDFGPDAPANHISPAAYDLIVQHETGGRSYYEKVYKGRPVWPGAQSGITIGFGYDLGYYSSDTFKSDWSALPPAIIGRLLPSIGLHGGKMPDAQLKQLVQDLRDISISWDTAQTVFRTTTLPVYATKTWNSLPNCEGLPSDCFGALVSITFNRGNSYSIPPEKDPTNRYAEMRDIKSAMTRSAFAEIPALMRSMERIWHGTAIAQEMTSRREQEAALFEAALATTQS